MSGLKRKPIGIFTDRVHTIPRRWSNRELEKYAHHFSGDIVNVSAWKDEDKEGNHYRDYFRNASSYHITNYVAEARGLQGTEGEIFLNLEGELPDELKGRFDTVFNHTTLEHVFDVHAAFANLCEMSRDCVILVVPFLQQYHADYGDYWRMTPRLLDKLFEKHGLQTVHISFNNHKQASVYIFAVAARQPEKYAPHFPDNWSVVDPTASGSEPFVGCFALANRWFKSKRFLESCAKLRFLRNRTAQNSSR